MADWTVPDDVRALNVLSPEVKAEMGRMKKKIIPAIGERSYWKRRCKSNIAV